MIFQTNKGAHVMARAAKIFRYFLRVCINPSRSVHDDLPYLNLLSLPGKEKVSTES